ncbi:hypothetical protein FJV41_16105 [Myxococcus llanfairpwllgwyngyllgogerychwyrndrobwllllantysiliogogogochensis]|uniref:Uncharacterized protein n=2 Tax=Myxococcus llanfairpwllgwyngyllgogerychwyrndrobwllllantysiliogogogochensis TaxID=2590453 RepID=A0A540X138_9BACT|nr:hypothetical protein FJV41_16105 [Myxococcus llanfairpwllgwyngyllgogerychwyrndrobwllllantysiliogogogochensis]
MSRTTSLARAELLPILRGRLEKARAYGCLYVPAEPGEIDALCEKAITYWRTAGAKVPWKMHYGLAQSLMNESGEEAPHRYLRLPHFLTMAILFVDPLQERFPRFSLANYDLRAFEREVTVVEAELVERLEAAQRKVGELQLRLDELEREMQPAKTRLRRSTR